MIYLLSVSFPISENVNSTRADIFLSFVCCHIPELRIVPGMEKMLQFSMIQSLGHVRLFVTPWTAARQASLSLTNSWSLLKLVSIESVMPSNHLILCRPCLLLPSSFPSIRVFSNESALSIRWPKYWSFSFSINPSNEYSGLISFRMDWLDLLAVQGTLKIFSNTKWADYLKRDQVQCFQGRLSGINDYLKMRNKGVDSQV